MMVTVDIGQVSETERKKVMQAEYVLFMACVPDAQRTRLIEFIQADSKSFVEFVRGWRDEMLDSVPAYNAYAPYDPSRAVAEALAFQVPSPRLPPVLGPAPEVAKVPRKYARKFPKPIGASTRKPGKSKP